jgi:hypothetical protein
VLFAVVGLVEEGPAKRPNICRVVIEDAGKWIVATVPETMTKIPCDANETEVAPRIALLLY